MMFVTYQMVKAYQEQMLKDASLVQGGSNGAHPRRWLTVELFCVVVLVLRRWWWRSERQGMLGKTDLKPL